MAKIFRDGVCIFDNDTKPKEEVKKNTKKKVKKDTKKSKSNKGEK